MGQDGVEIKGDGADRHLLEQATMARRLTGQQLLEQTTVARGSKGNRRQVLGLTTAARGSKENCRLPTEKLPHQLVELELGVLKPRRTGRTEEAQG